MSRGSPVDPVTLEVIRHRLLSIPEQLETNIKALIDALNRARPANSKGIYLRKVALSSTMGVGVKVDPAAFSAAATAA